MTPTTPTTFQGLVTLLLDFIDILILAVFTLTFVVILWRVIDTWILNPADQPKRDAGKQVVITAVWVLVVMSGIWGLLYLLRYGIFGT